MANSGFESMRNLKNVVEGVHRRNAQKLLESLGVSAPETATWEELSVLANSVPDPQEHVIQWTDYAGRVPVDGLFGLNDWRLVDSHPTEEVSDVLDTFPNSYNFLHNNVQINLKRGGDAIEVRLTPDVPPVAMYEADIDYVKVLHTRGKPKNMTNDAAILEAVRQEFGEGSVYYLDERTARNLINALLSDDSHCASLEP